MLDRNKIKVAVAIPAKNEQRTIGSIVMLSKKHADKVLVVNDGSTDKTALVALLAGAEVLSHKYNKGKGAAIVTALKWAVKENIDIIIFIDGDGQHDPGAIPDLIKPILWDDTDISIGSRWHHEQGLREMPFHRMLGNWVLSTATSLSLSKMIRDSQSGYRAFHRRTFPAFMQAMEIGFAVESEMIALADKAGFRWKEVGIKASYFGLDANTESSWYHGFTVLGKALRLLRLQKPGRFFGALSVFSFFLVITLAFWGKTAYPDEKLLPLWMLYFVAFFIITGGFFMFAAIMLSGMNRISERIFKSVMQLIER
ncbi:MAG TPA: glycosyltransferase family 2 protein [Euryarchaeota archaeon]|nr:glycosyltransferase family 2 protein [Euryarchaeota archaeon]